MKLIWLLWAIWYAYWIVSVRNRIQNSETSEAKKESRMGRLFYMFLMMAGFALLIWDVPLALLSHRLWPSNGTWFAIGTGIEIIGMAFAIWARNTLGKNWTGRITTGGTQEMVTSGPYKFVRHPIYSGLLAAILGTAIAIGQVRGFVGALIVLAGILIKLQREEAALREHFGTAYEEYSQRVSAVVPLP